MNYYVVWLTYCCSVTGRCLISNPKIIAIRDILQPVSLNAFDDVYVISELMDTDLHHACACMFMYVIVFVGILTVSASMCPGPCQLKSPAHASEGIKPKYYVGLPLMLHVFSHMLPSWFTSMQSLSMVLQPAILAHTAHKKSIHTKYSHRAHIPATYLHIPANTCKCLQHTYCFICRYVVGISCRNVVGMKQVLHVCVGIQKTESC